MSDSKLLQKMETEYKKGYSKPFILFAIAENPGYPFQLSRDVLKSSDGQISIIGSNIYPMLKDLENKNFICYKEDPETNRKTYHLTSDGKVFLHRLINNMNQFNEIIAFNLKKFEK
ncbi:MAG: PadR family transcriptional regulator [Candidatus Hodarchaeales archaeon]